MVALQEVNSLGVLGGTFDPIHFGHLLIAEQARIQYDLDKVLFVPAGVPPHKERGTIASARDRYIMAELATLSNPYFSVSRVDLDREGTSYTVDTLRMLKEESSGAELFFIAGADSLLQIASWRKPAEILSLCHFLAANRPGYSLKDVGEHLGELAERFGDRIHVFEVPALAVSATELRRRLQEGLSVKYMTPDVVISYIEKERLYRG